MRIDRLVIGGFGLFNRGITVDFQDAPFVVVLGDNESGKSTIMDAVVATVFGFASTNAEESRRPWGQHDLYSCAVALRMEDSSMLEIARNFESNDVRVRQKSADEVTTLFSGKASPRSKSPEAKRYAALLEDKLTLAEASLFHASVFVRQEQLATAFGEGMRRVVSGSVGADYEQSHTALQEKFFLLTRSNPWGARDKQNPRQIEILESEKDGIHQKLNDSQEAEHKLNELLSQRDQCQRTIEQLKKETDETQRTLDDVSRLNQLKQQRDRLGESETALRRELEALRGTKQRIADIERDLTEKYPDFDGAGMPFQQKLALSSELEDETRRREQALSIEEGRFEVARRKERRIAGLILSAVLSIAFGVASLRTVGKTGWVGFLVGGALGYLLSGLVPRMLGGRSATARTRVSMLKEHLTEILERRDQIVNEIVALCGTSDVTTISVQFEEYRALKTQLQRAEEDVRRSRSEDETQGENHKTVQELAVVQTQIDKLLEASPSLHQLGEDLQEALALEASLKSTLEQKFSELESAKQRLGELSTEIARQSASGVYDRLGLEEQLEQMDNELARLTSRRDALKCAVDVLAESIAEYRKDYLPRLERGITDQFSAIVGNRYSAIHFDKSLEPRVDGPDRADILPAALSVGTRDQLYFAMRIAFAKEISRGETLPLILDDPFVNFDEQRLAAVYRILKSASEGRQIILFTHDRRLSNWGELVVDLNKAATS